MKKFILSTCIFFTFMVGYSMKLNKKIHKPFEINYYYWWTPIGDGCYQLVQEIEFVGDNGGSISSYSYMTGANWAGTYVQCNNNNTSVWDSMC
jgi:hypothetical protein